MAADGEAWTDESGANRPVRVERPTLVFDGDCAFCSSAARWLAAHVRPSGRIVPFQGPDVDLEAHGVDPVRASREVLWLQPWGPVRGGERAIAAALRSSPRQRWRLVGSVLDLPVLHVLAARVYRWVARHRDRLPGGAPACAVPEAGGRAGERMTRWRRESNRDPRHRGRPFRAGAGPEDPAPG